MSFRRRLAWTSTAFLVAGYAVFAIISIAVLDRSLRSTVDAKLTTVARAAADLIDDRNGTPSVDRDDIAQFTALRTSDEHLGVFTPSGRLLYGEAVPRDPAGISSVRAKAMHDGHYLGWAIAWRDASWIGTVRRSAIVAFVLAGSALAILVFVFSGRYARAILAPVERVANLAERIESSDLSQRIDAKGNDELARLCASFDRMLERLQASFETERRFVSDASHELRAPLAVVRAETDLALRRNRSAAEYRSALESIGRETLRLERLVDNLLQTMRQQAIGESGPFNALDLTETLVTRMRSAARSIDLQCDAREPLVCGSREAVERALSAVLHNAIAHGGGNVSVRIGASDETVRVVIADEGDGFSEQALAHATERFWRGDSARSRGGTGLGLSIARVLVEAHGGSVTLQNEKHGGAIVTIALPRYPLAAAAV